MAFVLNALLPLELVWEIEIQKQKLCMKDVVEEYNTVNNFIKRNTEDSYYYWLLKFAKNKNAMWEETLTDEDIIKYWPETFGNGITKENREELYNELHSEFDDNHFQEDYSDKIYSSYDEFRLGDWMVEEYWL